MNNVSCKKIFFFLRNFLTARPVRKWIINKIKFAYYRTRKIKKEIGAAVVAAQKPVIIYVSAFEYYYLLTQRPHHIYAHLAAAGYPVVMCSCKVQNIEQIHPSFFLINPSLLKSIAYLEVPKILHFANGTPLSHWKIDQDTVVFYELIDDFSLHMEKKIEEQHKLMFQTITSRERTWTLVSANHLHDLAIKLGVPEERIILSRNAVNPEDFSSTDGEPPHPLRGITAKGKPIIGYYGALTVLWFDFDLMKQLIRGHQEWEFVFIGIIYGDTKEAETTAVVEELARYDNFTYLPPIPYAEISKYARYFSVATIPFLINDITLGTNPVKIFEYMAMGLPIVTTPMPECRLYQSALIADGADEFAAQIEKAISLKDNAMYQSLLKKESRENTWKSRVWDILRIVEKEKQQNAKDPFDGNNEKKLLCHRRRCDWPEKRR